MQFELFIYETEIQASSGEELDSNPKLDFVVKKVDS